MFHDFIDEQLIFFNTFRQFYNCTFLYLHQFERFSQNFKKLENFDWKIFTCASIVGTYYTKMIFKLRTYVVGTYVATYERDWRIRSWNNIHFYEIDIYNIRFFLNSYINLLLFLHLVLWSSTFYWKLIKTYHNIDCRK